MKCGGMQRDNVKPEQEPSTQTTTTKKAQKEEREGQGNRGTSAIKGTSKTPKIGPQALHQDTKDSRGLEHEFLERQHINPLNNLRSCVYIYWMKIIRINTE
jgi:hypothetical protein